jgi:hypothetical protein
MIDVRSKHFQSCLHDVIRWCATRPIAGEVEDSPAVVRLREQFGHASHFIDEARQAVGRSWRHRKIQDTEQWKAGQEILAEIVHSLGPAARELRSSSLSPTRPLSSSMSPQDWSQAVAEVVGKRSQMVKPDGCRRFRVRQVRTSVALLSGGESRLWRSAGQLRWLFRYR